MTYYYYHNNGIMPRVFVFSGKVGRAYFFENPFRYVCSSNWNLSEMSQLNAEKIHRDEVRGIIGRRLFNKVRATVLESLGDNDFDGLKLD